MVFIIMNSREFVNTEFFISRVCLKGNEDWARLPLDHCDGQALGYLVATSSMMAEIFSERT